PFDLARGMVAIGGPQKKGAFSVWTVVVAMIGAVGGSLMNLAYPYFIEAKGWRGRPYHPVPCYAFLVGGTMLSCWSLSVWILGAQVLYPDRTIERLDDLPLLLSEVLGERGRVLFYLGIFAAIYTSVLGHAAGLACLGSHAWQRWQS